MQVKESLHGKVLRLTFLPVDFSWESQSCDVVLPVAEIRRRAEVRLSF